MATAGASGASMGVEAVGGPPVGAEALGGTAAGRAAVLIGSPAAISAVAAEGAGAVAAGKTAVADTGAGSTEVLTASAVPAGPEAPSAGRPTGRPRYGPDSSMDVPFNDSAGRSAAEDDRATDRAGVGLSLIHI